MPFNLRHTQFYILADNHGLLGGEKGGVKNSKTRRLKHMGKIGYNWSFVTSVANPYRDSTLRQPVLVCGSVLCSSQPFSERNSNTTEAGPGLPCQSVAEPRAAPTALGLQSLPPCGGTEVSRGCPLPGGLYVSRTVLLQSVGIFTAL